MNKNLKHSWQLRICILASCLTASLLPAVNAHAQQKPIKPAEKLQPLHPISGIALNVRQRTDGADDCASSKWIIAS